VGGVRRSSRKKLNPNDDRRGGGGLRKCCKGFSLTGCGKKKKDKSIPRPNGKVGINSKKEGGPFSVEQNCYREGAYGEKKRTHMQKKGGERISQLERRRHNNSTKLQRRVGVLFKKESLSKRAGEGGRGAGHQGTD